MAKKLFRQSPHLAPEINSSIVEAEIEGGVDLNQVTPQTVFEMVTENRTYTIEYKGAGDALISGHPVFCSDQEPVQIHGSTWGGSMLWKLFIGHGMRLEFQKPNGETITTSRVLDIRERASVRRAA